MNWADLRNSLRLRLLLGMLAWIVLAVVVAGWGLRGLFQVHIAQQLEAQLVLQLDQLSAAIDWLPGSGVSVDEAGFDARLQQPLSGLYWQIDEAGEGSHATLAHSRSLWDETLALPPAPAGYPARGWRTLQVSGASGARLIAVARTLELPEDDAPRLRLVVAADTALLAEPLSRFTRMLLLALGVLAAGLLAAVAVQLQLTLRPLARLRAQLAAVRSGRTGQIAGRFPQELQPLVSEFNHVLAENAEIVQRARTQAGNLAHAVHTPLAVLANAAGSDRAPLAQLVREQVQIAQRQVDYHLARARASAAVRATGLSTPVLEPLQALLRTMRRLHAERDLAFELALDPQPLAFRGESQDLYEMLGNLLDNAGKWARSRVSVDLQPAAGGQLVVTIDDDGPGISEAERERMFERGVRLDERQPGSGLGLDIVRTLAQTYGGRVEGGSSPPGGARLRLYLPRADAA